MSIALFNASRLFHIPAQTWLWSSMTVFRPSPPRISIAYVCRFSIGMRPQKSGDVLPYTLKAYGPILKNPRLLGREIEKLMGELLLGSRSILVARLLWVIRIQE